MATNMSVNKAASGAHGVIDRAATAADETARMVKPAIDRTTQVAHQAVDKAAGVANGPINNLRQVFEEPQVIARGMRFDLPHATAGTVPLVRSPMRFSATPLEHKVPPPTLGQHTEEILRDVLGKDSAEIAKLRAERIV